jgi:hypothetical protein
MKVTDPATSLKILMDERHKFKPFVGKGLLGGGFLDDKRVKYHWHGVEITVGTIIPADSDCIRMPMIEVFEILGIKKVIPPELAGNFIAFRFVAAPFDAMCSTTIVAPAIEEAEVYRFIHAPLFTTITSPSDGAQTTET